MNKEWNWGREFAEVIECFVELREMRRHFKNMWE